MSNEETILISSIITADRIRTDLGDIDALATSIREFGLIQPIVLIEEHNPWNGEGVKPPQFIIKLVAGGRRLTALKRLGWKELIHAKHFIWRDEKGGTPEIDLKMQAIEIEENVRRKDLSWQETVLGQQRLLKLMQQIHGGPAKAGAPTRGEKYHGEVLGFGVNKLAAMLGMSAGSVSQNIALANAITAVPQLAQAETKESARRQFTTLGTIVQMQKTATVAATTVQGLNDSIEKEKRWTLYEGDTLQNIQMVASESIDLVYTDLPFGVGLGEMSKHSKGVISYTDSRKEIVDILGRFSSETFRVLREDRFCVFWFGFNYYSELLSALTTAGFKVNAVPFIWFKNSRSTENPNSRYGNSYDPAIIAMKGSPTFIRPGMQNFFSFPQPTGVNKLQIAQQPVELVTRFLQDMVVPGATIADFTAGSGTTGVAAVKFGCKSIMFEREIEACAVIKARMGILK